MVLAAALCLLTSGCMKSLKEHSTALAAATAPVVEQAAAAYRAANAIHEKRMDYDAIPAFEKNHSIEELRVVHPLIADEDIEVRMKVLVAFQLYVSTLVEITNGTSSPALDDAAKSAGGAIAGLGNTVAPSVDASLGITLPSASTTVTTVTSTSGGKTTTAATTTATPVPAISTTTQNILSTGANALGQFLVSRAIEKDLPKEIEKLDPQVLALCRLMMGEIDAINDAERIDFNYMLSEEKQMLMDPSIPMSEVERRNEIEKMQRLVREQQAADLELGGLKKALYNLAMTHHAYAAEVSGNNPASIKEKLGELFGAGASLGKFYSSLPTS
jgi:hypothetical protein